MVELIIGFCGGVLTAVGTYITFRQFRRSEPQIDLVVARSTNLSPAEIAKGYHIRFDFGVLNRKDVAYALFDIQVRPRSRRLSRRLGPYDREWIELRFDEVWNVPDLAFRQPLMLNPYEYRELTGYWWNGWVGDSPPAEAEKYWSEHPDDRAACDELTTAARGKQIEYRLRFADGVQRTYYFGPSAGLARLLAIFKQRPDNAESKWPQRSV